MNTDLKSWMSQISDERNLFSLSLAGTHDCATKYVQLSYFTKCQNKNIYEQLSMGIRALDVRVELGDKGLGVVHGISKAYNSPNRLSPQMDIGDVISHCTRFLSENKSECVIFQFKNDSGKNMEKCFDVFYKDYISKNPDLWYTENRIPTLSEVRGKIVLIRRCKIAEGGEYSSQNTGIDFSRWAEQDEIIPDALVLKTNSADNADFIIQDRYRYKPRERWSECIKPFLDSRAAFDGQYIVCFFSTAGGISGPRNNAKYINRQLLGYELDKSKYYGIMYLDFPNEEIVEKIISLNL